jgi:type VI protein secretion system component Hcp
MAQIQIYLKLKLKQNGLVTGPASATGHVGDLLIDSYRWSGGIESGSAGGKFGAGTSLSVKDFEFTMAMSRASPIVMQSCLMMDPVIEATLACRHQQTQNAEDFVVWTLTNGVISSYETLGAGDQIIPKDRFTIRFRAVQLNFRIVAADGSLGTTITTSFDFGTMTSGSPSSSSSAGSGGGGGGGGGSAGGGGGGAGS